MTDMDAIEYLEELMKFNRADQMTTPQNKKFDTFYQCAFEHAIRALKNGLTEDKSVIPERSSLDDRILTLFKETIAKERSNNYPAVNTPEQEDIIIDEIKKFLLPKIDDHDIHYAIQMQLNKTQHTPAVGFVVN